MNINIQHAVYVGCCTEDETWFRLYTKEKSYLCLLYSNLCEVINCSMSVSDSWLPCSGNKVSRLKYNHFNNVQIHRCDII